MNLMIVDDHEGVRGMIRCLLARPGDMVQECGNADDAVRLAATFQPDYVTMDLRMPGLCAFAATRAIGQICADARVIIVSSHDNVSLRLESLDAGAMGYVAKDDLAVLPHMVLRNPKVMA